MTIRQSKHLSRFSILTILTLFLALACAQFGPTPVKRAPNGMKESLYMSAMTIRGMAIAVGQLRVDRIITDGQMSTFIDQLQDAKNTLQKAKDAYALGHVDEAQMEYGNVETSLRMLAVLLEDYEATHPAGGHAVFRAWIGTGRMQV